jgi:hypothetical protein
MSSWLLSRLSVGCVAAAFFSAAIGSDGSQPISDEALRIVAVQAVFPQMQVSVDPAKKIDDSSLATKPSELSFPDALAGEIVYRVVGKAMNKAESWASDDVINPGRFSNAREVRFKLFRWPNEGTDGLLAVLQYDFPGANPAMSCPSIGLLIHLARKAANWELRDEYLLETVHHHSMQGIKMLDLTGDGTDELVIESDFGGAGVSASSMQVFDLSHGHFQELLSTESELADSDQEGFTQTLDIGATVRSNGQRFCFTKTTLFEKGKWFKSPQVSHPCYKRGYLVDTGASGHNAEMLAPLR